MSENKILHDPLSKDFASKDEVRELIRLYKKEKNEERKLELREQIFLNNIRYIKKISLKFSRMYSDPEDCFQNGVLGFFDALDKFELDKDTAFSTYLFYWVYKYIFEGCQKSIVTIPRNVQFMNYSYQKYKEIMDSEEEGSHADFLSNKLFQSDVFKKKYLENENVNPEIKVISINQESNANNNAKGKVLLLNVIRDNKPNPEQIAINRVNNEQLLAIINEKLSEREREIIILRYFNDSDSLMTLKEIVEVVGTTSERVRQIEERALEKLRKVFIKLRRQGGYEFRDQTTKHEHIGN